MIDGSQQPSRLIPKVKLLRDQLVFCSAKKPFLCYGPGLRSHRRWEGESGRGLTRRWFSLEISDCGFGEYTSPCFVLADLGQADFKLTT